MQTTKYTPGPWLLTAGRMIETTSGRFYLTYHTEQRTGRAEFQNFTELDANARLVAATPDLFEACRAALAYLQDTTPLEHGNPALGKVWGLLESALKQATKA